MERGDEKLSCTELYSSDREVLIMYNFGLRLLKPNWKPKTMDTHSASKLELLNKLQKSINILEEKFTTIPHTEKGIFDRSNTNPIDAIMGEYKKSLGEFSRDLSDYINFQGEYESSAISKGLIKKNDIWKPITTDEDREKARYSRFKAKSEVLIANDFNESNDRYQQFKGTDPHLYFNIFISLVQAFFHIFDFSNETKNPDKYWFKHKNSHFRERESFVKSVAGLVKEFEEMVTTVDLNAKH